MAPEKKDKKRKAPAVSDPPAKKTKKVEAKAAETTKDDAPKPILKKKQNGTVKSKETKETNAAPAPKANGEPVRQVKPRKRAADFLGDEEDDEATLPASAPSKKASNKKTKTDSESVSAGKKGASKAKKVEVPEESEEEGAEDVQSLLSEAEDESEDEGEDDQTAAMIKGFESSGDEDDSGDDGYTPGKPVPKIPDSKKVQKKIMKKQKEDDVPEEPGTVYIGRIPHGFYEHQMRAYFSQFGEITRLRLSRNRLTGRSKHYAFVEFASTTVAKIVAETMDNYLMYGHILKCKFVPAEQLHPEIWKGANRRFKRTPWNRIEKKRLEKGKTREQWSKRIEQEQQKRQEKAEKLKALGYEIDLPKIKSVDEMPVQEETKAIEAGEKAVEEPVKAIEAPAASEDTPKAKKGKKADQETPKEAGTESPASKPKKKAKKASKAKA